VADSALQRAKTWTRQVQDDNASKDLIADKNTNHDHVLWTSKPGLTVLNCAKKFVGAFTHQKTPSYSSLRLNNFEKRKTKLPTAAANLIAKPVSSRWKLP